MFRIGKCHPIASTNSVNMKEILRLPIRLKIFSGSYILQSRRSGFNNVSQDSTCLLCKCSEETLSHFLLTCEKLDCVRTAVIPRIIEICSQLFAKHKIVANIDLLTLIVNPFYYCTQLSAKEFILDISNQLEPLCRCLCYRLHTKRYELLGITVRGRY